MRLKKILSVTFISTLLIVVSFVSYLNLKEQEVTKVTLKCAEEVVYMKDKPIRTEYYRITKKIFDDSPVNLLISYPDTSNKSLDPNVIGIYEKLPEVSNIEFKRKFYYPEYYLFITNPNEVVPCKDCEWEVVQTVTYLKRSDLEIVTTLIGDGTIMSKGKCEIVDNDLFDKDWKSKVEKIKKDQKI